MLKTSANKNVFKCLLKVAGVDWRRMWYGRRFQAAGPRRPARRTKKVYAARHSPYSGRWSKTAASSCCRNSLYSVWEIRWRSLVVNGVHQCAEFKLHSWTDRQPVQLHQMMATWSRWRKSNTSRAAAFCTLCNGSRVDCGRPASTELQ